MKKDIIIPEAGESVTEADIVSWYKHNGDFVVMDDPIVELETDKASMDLTAEISGILTISIKGGTVKVGQVIGSIEESKEGAPAKTKSTDTPSDKSAKSNVEPVKSDGPAPITEPTKTKGINKANEERYNSLPALRTENGSSLRSKLYLTAK